GAAPYQFDLGERAGNHQRWHYRGGHLLPDQRHSKRDTQQRFFLCGSDIPPTLQPCSHRRRGAESKRAALHWQIAVVTLGCVRLMGTRTLTHLGYAAIHWSACPIASAGAADFV